MPPAHSSAVCYRQAVLKHLCHIVHGVETAVPNPALYPDGNQFPYHADLTTVTLRGVQKWLEQNKKDSHLPVPTTLIASARRAVLLACFIHQDMFALHEDDEKQGGSMLEGGCVLGTISMLFGTPFESTYTRSK
jgi:hypothetical protein